MPKKKSGPKKDIVTTSTRTKAHKEAQQAVYEHQKARKHAKWERKIQELIDKLEASGGHWERYEGANPKNEYKRLLKIVSNLKI